jgi:hypothetical protein
LTFARATFVTAGRLRGSLLVEPRVRFGLRDDGEDLDLRFCNVIEHPDVSNSQVILRLAQPTKPFDAALTDLPGLVRQVHGRRLDDPGSHGHRQALERGNGARRKNDVECHSGYILAKIGA